DFIQCLLDAEATLAAEVGLGPGVEEIADMLWLAQQLPRPGTDTSNNAESSTSELGTSLPTVDMALSDEPRPTLPHVTNPPEQTPLGTLSTQPVSAASTEAAETVKPLMIPAAAAFRHPLKLSRSLRRLIRKTASRTQTVIDEEATAIALAEENPIGVVEQPAQERWLDLELVIEQSRVASVWDPTSKEFGELLERLGAFRSIRIWTLITNETSSTDEPEPRLIAGCPSSAATSNRFGKPKELLNATGLSLVMLLSDCISPLWRSGKIHGWIADWAKSGPTVIIQWFPERYWSRTGLKAGRKVWLSALTPGMPSDRWERHYPTYNPDDLDLKQPTSKLPTKSVVVPVVSLEAEALEDWARVVAGCGEAQVQGCRFELSWEAMQQRWQGPVKPAKPLPKSGEERFIRFDETASGLAKQLAGLMALGPVSPEVTHLIQETLLPQSGPIQVAEVFLSGLLEATDNKGYQWFPGVQERLQQSMLKVDQMLVFRVLSQYISKLYGCTPREFKAFLQKHSDWGEAQWNQLEGFAELRQSLQDEPSDAPLSEQQSDEPPEDVTTVADPSLKSIPELFPELPLEVLEIRTCQLVETAASPAASYPILRSGTETFTIATVELLASSDLEPFDITIATLVQAEGQWEIQLQPGQAYGFIEALSPDLTLAMVAIPSGKFLMGSPQDEEGYEDYDGPQHEVTTTGFFMGRYPVTQAQWQFVASLPQEQHSLDPDLSNFKGDTRPVEQVSWDDAMEFCARLSTHTGREYRLPTEAEWEYACRAGTTTPFHFGETISPELANYDASSAYNDGPTGKYLGETTPVDQFEYANAFGLSDMHGNVWEWCLDHWHENYQEAPTDGSAWLTDNDNGRRVRRGGSWRFNPRNCRSAYRNFNSTRDYRLSFIGFRVVSVAPRTLP
ncbi:MAG: formylglycine-generating enzyme family protein, partial [Cyanobacteria bacterium J06636_16]